MSKNREQLIIETRDDVIPFLEDLDHLKRVSEAVETSPVDLRHASVVLRRWVVEGLLQRIANPRVGKIEIQAIDNNPIYRATRNENIESFVSGGAQVHGLWLAAGMANIGREPPVLADYHPDSLISLSLDSFRKQRVLFSEGEWFTRDQVIKFVANVDHGVHAGKTKEKWEKTLANFRQTVSVSLGKNETGEKTTLITWEIGKRAQDIDIGKYDPSKINGVLLEITATIRFLISSPSIENLALTLRSAL